eukprot:TRINITY_DN14612_c0_g1_i8.p1 TRINITY_DN14612_c0_g1~~TRINITY_DN14612_c0_g1_i8.p1  ORF type:complete len:1429 (+),score=325.69 TRINITY_DN14612_c0_g1_i8:311-4597(+)
MTVETCDVEEEGLGTSENGAFPMTDLAQKPKVTQAEVHPWWRLQQPVCCQVGCVENYEECKDSVVEIEERAVTPATLPGPSRPDPAPGPNRNGGWIRPDRSDGDPGEGAESSKGLPPLTRPPSPTHAEAMGAPDAKPICHPDDARSRLMPPTASRQSSAGSGEGKQAATCPAPMPSIPVSVSIQLEQEQEVQPPEGDPKSPTRQVSLSNVSMHSASMTSAASNRSTQKSKAKMEHDHVPDIDVSMEDLIRNAEIHRMQHACTVYDEKTDKWEWRSLWSTTPAELGLYGIGTQIYFEFLAGIGLVFLACFFLSLPQFIVSSKGSLVDQVSGAEEVNVLNKFLAWSSLGNIGYCTHGLCRATDDYWHKTVGEDDDMPLRDLSEAFGILDGLALWLFVLFGAVFEHIWVPLQVKRQDEKYVTSADYAVSVTRLPRHLGHKELHSKYKETLSAHFETVLKSEGFDRENMVREVTLMHEYDGAIFEFMKQGELIEQRDNMRAAAARARKDNDEASADRAQEKAESLQDQIIQVEIDMEKQAAMKDEEREVCFAVIMFDTEELKNAVLQKYKRSRSWILRMFQRRDLQFHGKKIKVEQAPEPTDLYWENLDYEVEKHECRRLIMIMCAFTCILGALLALVWLRTIAVAPTTAVAPKVLWMIRWPLSDASAENANSFSLPGLDNHWNGEPCMELCGWRLTTDTFCENSLGGKVTHVYSRTGLEWERGEGDSLHPLLEGTNCSRTWAWNAESLDCQAPRLLKEKTGGAASHERLLQAGPTGTFPTKRRDDTMDFGYVAFEFADPQKVLCTEFKLPDRASGMHTLELWSCEGNDFTRSGQELAKYCVQMGDVINKEIKNPVRMDARCRQEITLDTAQRAKEKLEEIGDSMDNDNGMSLDAEKKIKCFCEEQLLTQGLSFQLGWTRLPASEVCEDFTHASNMQLVKKILGVIAIVILNTVLLLIFSFMDVKTRYRTATDHAASQTVNLFLSQLVNTAFVWFLIDVNLRGWQPGFLKAMQLGAGNHDDISPMWFATTGSSILIVVVFQMGYNLVMPPVFILLVDPLMVKWARKGLVTQKPLNDAYLLPDWTLSLRLGETLSCIVCVMMYSGGMPCLYLFGCMYCVAAYWVDKWSLLRGSRQPPAYNEFQMKTALRCLPFATVLHVIMGVITFSNQDVLPSDWSAFVGVGEGLIGMDREQYDRIMTVYHGAGSDIKEALFSDYMRARCLDVFRKSTWPSFLVIFATVFYWVGYLLVMITRPCCKWFDIIVDEIQNIITSQAKKILPKDLFNEEKVTEETYDEAAAMAVEKNLVFSYRMQANPRYKEASDALTYDPSVEEMEAFHRKQTRSLSGLFVLLSKGIGAMVTVQRAGAVGGPTAGASAGPLSPRSMIPGSMPGRSNSGSFDGSRGLSPTKLSKDSLESVPEGSADAERKQSEGAV